MSGDIGKWYRKSLKALEKGRSADVEFETEEIGEEERAVIHMRLTDCETAEDVKGVFAHYQSKTPPQPSPSLCEGEGERIGGGAEGAQDGADGREGSRR